MNFSGQFGQSPDFDNGRVDNMAHSTSASRSYDTYQGQSYGRQQSQGNRKRGRIQHYQERTTNSSYQSNNPRNRKKSWSTNYHSRYSSKSNEYANHTSYKDFQGMSQGQQSSSNAAHQYRLQHLGCSRPRTLPSVQYAH